MFEEYKAKQARGEFEVNIKKDVEWMKGLKKTILLKCVRDESLARCE
jgi:hypothetical protein